MQDVIKNSFFTTYVSYSFTLILTNTIKPLFCINSVMVEKREFKAPWKEAEYSMHETHPTPSHVSQKWMDMFSFGKKSSIGYDGEDDKGERHEKKQTDTTFGSQRVCVCCFGPVRPCLHLIFIEWCFCMHIYIYR